ncbi:E3 ubiquitin-protein ligase [Entamoeba marina]
MAILHETLADVLNKMLEMKCYDSNENILLNCLFPNGYSEFRKACTPILPSCICRNQSGYGEQSVVYRCRTCEKTENSCICSECFNLSNHVGHDYEKQISIDAYTCDCGNPLCWDPKGFCSKHGATFNGDIFSLIPSQYKQLVNDLKIVITTLCTYLMANNTECSEHHHQHQCSCDNDEGDCCCEEDLTQSGIDVIFQTLQTISDVYLFFNVFGNILNNPYDGNITINNKKYEQPTLGEVLYVMCKNRISKDHEVFITSFQTHPNMLQINNSLLFDFFMELSFDAEHENGFVINDLFSLFFLSKERNAQFLSSGTFMHFFASLNEFLTVVQTPQADVETLQNNVSESLRALNFLVQNVDIDLPLDTIFVYLSCLKKLSNVSPQYKGHPVTDLSFCFIEPMLFSVKSNAFYFVDSLSLDYAYTIFFDVHTFVMDHIRSYLVSTEQIKCGNVSISKRLIGTTQPVSPISPLLYFYSLLFIKLRRVDLDIYIPDEDAKLLCESALVSLCFRSQYERGEWLLSGEYFEPCYTLYLSPIHYELIHSDLALIQALLPIIGTEFVIATMAHYYNVDVYLPQDVSVDSIESFNVEKLQSVENINVTGFIMTLIQIMREYIIPAQIPKNDLIRLYCLHLFLSGITEVEEVSSMIPFFSADFYSVYETVMNDVFSDDKTVFDIVDPFFPLPIEMYKILFSNCLDNTSSSKANRYEINIPNKKVIPSYVLEYTNTLCNSNLLGWLLVVFSKDPTHVNMNLWSSLAYNVLQHSDNSYSKLLKKQLWRLEVNIVRGKGLLVSSIIRSQDAAPQFSHIYAALVAVLNTKIPSIGELLLHRLLYQYRLAIKRDELEASFRKLQFIAHLTNQQVCAVVLPLQLLLQFTKSSTSDDLERAIVLLENSGEFLDNVVKGTIQNIYEKLRQVIMGKKANDRVIFKINQLFTERRNGFPNFPAIIEDLDLIEEEDKISHEITLTTELKTYDELNTFSFDEEFEENEQKWEIKKVEIIGEESEEEEDGDNNEVQMEEENEVEKFDDQTGAALIFLKKKLYITIMSCYNYEECVHKLLSIKLKEGEEPVLVEMVIECCAQEKTYKKYYGLTAARLCVLYQQYKTLFIEQFASQYDNIHLNDLNRIRNISMLFSHLLSTHSIPWEVFSHIKLTEDDTTSSSRIFFKNTVPRHTKKKIVFAFNFFKGIGLVELAKPLQENYMKLKKRAEGVDD